MQFDQIITRAWQVIWKHKILWVFGILAGCGGQGTSNAYRGTSNWQYNESDVQNMPGFIKQWTYQFESFLNENTQAIIGFVALAIIVGLLISLIFLALGVFGQVGLVRGTLLSERGAATLTFGELWQETQPFFWRVLGLLVVVGLAYVALGLVLVGVIAVGSIMTLGLLAVCLIPLLCILVPISLLISVLVKQSVVALVVEDLDMLQAVTRGWEVVRNNLGSVLIMAIFLVIGSGFVNFLAGLPLAFTMLPMFASVFAGSQDLLFGSIGIMMLCVTLYLPIYLVLAGALRAFVDASWTLTYLELASPTMPDILEPESVIGEV